jgi:hypothetical protein
MPAKAGIQYSVTSELNNSAAAYWLALHLLYGNVYVTICQWRSLNTLMQMEAVLIGTSLRTSMLKPPPRSWLH